MIFKFPFVVFIILPYIISIFNDDEFAGDRTHQSKSKKEATKRIIAVRFLGDAAGLKIKNGAYRRRGNVLHHCRQFSCRFCAQHFERPNWCPELRRIPFRPAAFGTHMFCRRWQLRSRNPDAKKAFGTDSQFPVPVCLSNFAELTRTVRSSRRFLSKRPPISRNQAVHTA